MAFELQRRPPLLRRAIQFALSLAIVVGIFAYAIPRISDYSAVADAIGELTPVELVTLSAAMVFSLFTFWLANMAALPGLTLSKAAVVTQATTSVANTLPAGGAISVGLSYQILYSWRFSAQAITLYLGASGVWNIFVKLALPVVSLALLALMGQATAALVVASVIGLAVLVVAVVLFGLALSSKRLARRIGDRIGSFFSWLRRPFRRPAITTLGDHAADLRERTIVLIAERWRLLTVTTILSQLALWLVLLLSVRAVGISQAEVSAVQTLAVFAFGRLLGAISITPGGLGVVELGYIGGLGAAGGNEAQVVAAALLFRMLTYAIQIPIGGVAYLIWRLKRSWRQEIDDLDLDLEVASA